MKTKLILVEGIPGSGKSTIAKKIAMWLRRKGLPVKLFAEGDSHPADLAWHAVVPNEVLPNIKQKYSDLWPKIEQQMSQDKQYSYIAYTKVQTQNYNFYADMESYEVYDNRKGPELFDVLHFRRWEAFAKHAAEEDEIIIFECAFMQNQIGELLFCRIEPYAGIQAHMMKLASAITMLDPLLIYLSQPDIAQTILRVGKARHTQDVFDWLTQFVSYSEHTLYAKKHALHGFDGAIAMQEKRKQTELCLLETLPMQIFVQENIDFDWENVWQDIEKVLTKTFLN